MLPNADACLSFSQFSAFKGVVLFPVSRDEHRSMNNAANVFHVGV